MMINMTSCLGLERMGPLAGGFTGSSLTASWWKNVPGPKGVLGLGGCPMVLNPRAEWKNRVGRGVGG